MLLFVQPLQTVGKNNCI